MPGTVVWDSFSVASNGTCLAVPVKAGQCDVLDGSSTECATWTLKMSDFETVTLQLAEKPDGNGYGVAAYSTMGHNGARVAYTQSSFGVCLGFSSQQSGKSADSALQNAVSAATWLCGQ